MNQKLYYSHPIQANFGVKPVSNSKPVYDKHGNQKQSISYFGFKAHTLSFFNVSIFTFVFPLVITIRFMISLCCIRPSIF